MKVKKRDGSEQAFDRQKIHRAIMKAGLGDVDSVLITLAIVACVFDGITVDQIHDLVETELMQVVPEAAKAYVIFRHARDLARSKRTKPDGGALSDYIFYSKYARQVNGRYGSWTDSVDRLKSMHDWDDHEMWDLVQGRHIMPSMRSLQFVGKPIEQHNARMYNCCFTLIDRPRVFQEILYLLLCGCGVGFSVHPRHVSKLPPVKKQSRLVQHWRVEDTIEGWANAFGAALAGHFRGYRVEFDYSAIRPEGAPLASGGKAPGHLPLKTLLRTVADSLGPLQDRQMRPIEAHDLVCHSALAVLAGGVRRSSLISLFDPYDQEMLYAKREEQWGSHRAMANNSAILTDREDQATFDHVMAAQQHGEPGIFFAPTVDWGCNPCGEILLNPKYSRSTGFGFCNLTEVNGASDVPLETKVIAATRLGMLQARFTKFPYLGPTSEKIARRDALLGVSITGIMDNPDECLSPPTLQNAAAAAVRTNIREANSFMINTAKRITTVKPSGTASLFLKCAAGCHPHHARRYFRRVTANRLEAPAQLMKLVNPHMVEEKPDGDLCITFPVVVPDNAITVGQMSDIEFMNNVFSLYDNWVAMGSHERCHNVSCTVVYGDLDRVRAHLWKNRHSIRAMSFLPLSSDKGIPFMPREEVLQEDEDKWGNLVGNWSPVKYGELVPVPTSSLPVACGDDVCEVITVTKADGTYIDDEGKEVVWHEQAESV